MQLLHRASPERMARVTPVPRSFADTRMQQVNGESAAQAASNVGAAFAATDHSQVEPAWLPMLLIAESHRSLRVGRPLTTSRVNPARSAGE